MYKLIFNKKTVAKSKDEILIRSMAEGLYNTYIRSNYNHYSLRLRLKDRLIEDWSCACYTGKMNKVHKFLERSTTIPRGSRGTFRRTLLSIPKR